MEVTATVLDMKAGEFTKVKINEIVYFLTKNKNNMKKNQKRKYKKRKSKNIIGRDNVYKRDVTDKEYNLVRENLDEQKATITETIIEKTGLTQIVVRSVLALMKQRKNLIRKNIGHVPGWIWTSG
ncbi:unnamed protein product [marine sediment metagenome]|uniref:Uncharacterized protein n=1 Tax=marine sediment metagenome TaxID=412755 RepID=X0ZXZ3_9ZZZZ